MSHTPRRPDIRGALNSLVFVPLETRSSEAQEHRRSARVTGIAADVRQRLRLSEKALAEQQLLAREADHRVANGLQLVHSTLMLQAAATPDGAAREAIRAAARSVAAAAEAHRHLHGFTTLRQSPDTAPDAVVYLGDLVRKLTPTAALNGQVVNREIALRAEPGAAGAVSAGLLPRLGLIAAELITNALKHGAGPVLVELRPGSEDEGGGVVVAVSDQGLGFPVSFSPAANGGGSLGMRLLVTLSRPGRVWVDPSDRRRILVQLKERTLGSI
jgi:two-component sensor histidine kinase